MFAVAYARLERPAVMKDHRLTWTLSRIARYILHCDPKLRLVLNVKPLHLVEESTRRRRGGRYWWHRTPKRWAAAARNQYDMWSGDKSIVRHQRIRKAVRSEDTVAFLRELDATAYGIGSVAAEAAMRLYDPTRDDPGNPRQGNDGWESDHANHS